MRKQRFIQNVTIIVLGITIVFMSIGYAAFSSNIAITGTTTFESAFWDIHFENTIISSNTTVEDYERITPASLNSDTTSLNFGVSLRPGEVYEFITTIRNGGTYNGVLKNIDLNISKDNDEDNLNDSEFDNDNIKYTVTYHDDKEIKIGDEIGAGYYRKIKVRVEYLMPSNMEEIKEENCIFNINMNYIQQ